MLKKIVQLLQRFGLDQTTAIVALSKIWSSIAGVLSIFAVVASLSPKLQGYYYTFSSLVALQVVMEMGMTFVVSQFASHEVGNIDFQNTSLQPKPSELIAKRRLSSLLLFTIKWFSGASTALMVLLVCVGTYLFLDVDDIELHSIKVQWMLLIISVSGNLFVTAIASFLEGCGLRNNIAKMRFTQSVVSSCGLWIVLLGGGELYSIAVCNMISLLVGVGWILAYHSSILSEIYHFKSNHPGIKWRTEVFPFQWRIGVSWISGYLSFQAFSPILFKYQGAIAAGQMGMSLQLTNAVGAVAMSWITTRLPIFGGLASKKEYRILRKEFITAATQSTLVHLIGSAFMSCIFFIINERWSQYSVRILPSGLFYLIMLISFLNHLSGIMGAYMRVHKEEPLVWMSIICGIVTVIMTMLLAKKGDMVWVVVGYFFVSFFVGFCGTASVLKKFDAEVMSESQKS